MQVPGQKKLSHYKQLKHNVCLRVSLFMKSRIWDYLDLMFNENGRPGNELGTVRYDQDDIRDDKTFLSYLKAISLVKKKMSEMQQKGE